MKEIKLDALFAVALDYYLGMTNPLGDPEEDLYLRALSTNAARRLIGRERFNTMTLADLKEAQRQLHNALLNAKREIGGVA